MAAKMFENFQYLNLKDILFQIQIIHIQSPLMIDSYGPDMDSAFSLQTVPERNDLSKQFTYLLIPLV